MSDRIKQEDVIDFYEQLLASINVSLEDNYLSLNVDAETVLPVTIKRGGTAGRLVMPTREALRDPVEDNTFFHPLSESALRGESEVLKKLKYLMIFRLNSVASEVLVRLLDIIGDTDLHKGLTPKQKHILSLDPNDSCDNKTMKNLMRVISKSALDAETALVYMYLKRGGRLGTDREYSRVCKVTSPVLNNIDYDEREINSVPMRVNDMTLISGLLKYVIGSEGLELNEKVTYSTGTSYMTVPYFEVLLKSFYKVAKHLNSILHLFRKYFHDEYKSLKIDTGFMSYMDSLEALIVPIPTLEGNIGYTKEKPASETKHTHMNMLNSVSDQDLADPDPVPESTVPQNTTYNTTPEEPPVYNAPVVNTPPPPTDDGEGIPLNSIIPPAPTYATPPPVPPQVDQYGRPLQTTPNAPPPPPVDRYGRPLPPPPVDRYGRPLSPPPQVDQYGRPLPPPVPVDQYGRPLPPPPVDQYGRPLAPPQVDQYGRPLAPPPVDQYGRPLQAPAPQSGFPQDR